jgi:hypothetical protein
MRGLVVTGVAAAVVALGGVPAAVALSHGGAHHASHSVPGAHAPGRSDDRSQSEPGEKAGEDRGKAGDHGSAHAGQMVAVAAAHRVAMTHWSACVQAAAKAAKSNPTAGCVKPTPPGWVKHRGRH